MANAEFGLRNAEWRREASGTTEYPNYRTTERLLRQACPFSPTL